MVAVAAQRERHLEIDRLKAAAILGVIWLHCFNEWGTPRSTFARISFQVTSAAVPAFFFASGLLNYSASRFPRGTLARWALRLLPPYLAGSLAALAMFYARGEPWTARAMLVGLALGDVTGIYYFVFVLWECLLLSLALARLPWLALALFPVFALGPVLQALQLDPVFQLFGGGDSLTVLWRSPFTWLQYYLGGWLVARWRASIPWRPVGLTACAVWLASCIYLVDLPAAWGFDPREALIAMLRNFAAILAIVGLARMPRVSKPVLWLSTATYALFLWHYYVILWLQPILGASEGGRLVTFLLTLGITTACIATAQAIAPRASRWLLGA